MGAGRSSILMLKHGVTLDDARDFILNQARLEAHFGEHRAGVFHVVALCAEAWEDLASHTNGALFEVDGRWFVRQDGAAPERDVEGSILYEALRWRFAHHVTMVEA